MNTSIEGKAYNCGDNITAYQIIARDRWGLGLTPELLGNWVFEDAIPEVKNVEGGFKHMGYEIVVAGDNFGGGGKSIEHPIAALQGAGIKLLIADSFDRYNFRNAINRGLPAILCPGISKMAHSGDTLEANLVTGQIKNKTTGDSIQGAPLSELVLKFAEAGGMLNYFRNQDH